MLATIQPIEILFVVIAISQDVVEFQIIYEQSEKVRNMKSHQPNYSVRGKKWDPVTESGEIRNNVVAKI